MICYTKFTYLEEKVLQYYFSVSFTDQWDNDYKATLTKLTNLKALFQKLKHIL